MESSKCGVYYLTSSFSLDILVLSPNEIFVGCASPTHIVNCSSFACGAENGRKDESESCPRPSAAVATVSPFPVFFTRFVKICHPPSSNYYALYSHFVWLLIDDPVQCSWNFSDPNQPFYYFNCQLSDSAIIFIIPFEKTVAIVSICADGKVERENNYARMLELFFMRNGSLSFFFQACLCQ